MGIMQSFRDLGEYLSKHNQEKRIEKKVFRQSVQGEAFLNSYASFRNSLAETLVNKLGSKEIVIRPKGVANAKYCMMLMEDTSFTDYYNIHKTAGGTYAIKAKSASDSLTEHLKSHNLAGEDARR